MYHHLEFASKHWLLGALLAMSLWIGSLGKVWACHHGGPLGFASKNPGMLTVDLVSSPTFAFASTSGTSGCKNWDVFGELQRERQHYLFASWEALAQEASQGGGPHIEALTQLFGCPALQSPQISAWLRRHAFLLVTASGPSETSTIALRTKLQAWIAAHPELAQACESPLASG